MKSRTKKEIERISELNSAGLNERDIAKKIRVEFDEDINVPQVKRIIQRQVMLKKNFIKTDAEFKELHKEMLIRFIAKINKNSDMLDKFISALEDKYDELQQDIPESKLVSFSREISGLSRALNDTARTMNELLKRTETETSEIKVSTIDNIQNTVKILKDLERMGYLTIHEKELYGSDFYKEIKKNETD